MILIVGATGHLGMAVCQRLAKGDQPVRALARQTSNPESLDRLRGLGMEVVEIGGAEALSPKDALHIFETVLGAPFEVQYVPQAALEAQLAGTDDPHTQSVTALSLDFARGDVVDTTRMTALLPFERSTVSQYVEGLAR